MEEKEISKEEPQKEEEIESTPDELELANKKAYDAEKKCAELNDKYLRLMAE